MKVMLIIRICCSRNEEFFMLENIRRDGEKIKDKRIKIKVKKDEHNRWRRFAIGAKSGISYSKDPLADEAC
jgi:hypothetical protein